MFCSILSLFKINIIRIQIRNALDFTCASPMVDLLGHVNGMSHISNVPVMCHHHTVNIAVIWVVHIS